MRKLFLFFALTVGLLASASTLQAQTVNMNRYITLTVADGAAIKLDFSAAAAGTPVRIVSGSNIQNITVDNYWYGDADYTADGTTMTVYGDLKRFSCSGNGENLTALDLSHNTELKELNCIGNRLTTIDLSHNTQLTKLNCSSNQLTILDVSKNTKLEDLSCGHNNLTSLDVSKNTLLWGLVCFSNQLTTLDVSKNTKLTYLDCSSNSLTTLDVSKNTLLWYLACFFNQLTALDVSHNTKLKELNCYSNNLSSLDVLHNMELRNLYCYGNRFTTAALDDIYCSLPNRTGTTYGVIKPVHYSTAPDHDIVLATNSQNAIDKNWKVRYFNDINMPATTGSYVCPRLNMSRYITLTVTDEAPIRLDFKAAAAGTPIRIVSGSNMVDITVGTSWYGTASYTAGSSTTTMTIYGDLTGFDCSGNGVNLTALDPSHNTQLKILYCKNNSINSLDVSQNTQLKGLYCTNNTISYLEVLHNTQLIGLDCAVNQLSYLNVSNNTQLTLLDCSYNYLSVLDVSNNIQLENLYCHSNSLSSLDISQNTRLKNLSCHGNDFTIAAIDRIYCALPVRSASDGARIFPLGESSSVAEQNMVASTSGANAIAKNWRVLKYKEDGTHTDIATTGSYVCPEPNMSSYIILTVAKDSAIRLDFQAAAEGTTIRIVSGGRARDITVGTSLYGNTYTAYGTEMKIYGDLTGFVCSGNRGNLTALDPSHNTQLKWLSCSDNNLTSLDLSHNTQLEKLYCNKNQLTSLDLSHNTQLKQLFCDGNNFSTQALDDIYCALPLRQASDLAVIYPIYSASSSDHATVIATNAHNATDKNWSVLYYNSTDISTTGSYVCPAPTMDSYITLTVAKYSAIRLNLKAAAEGTPVRIVSGGRTRYITVDTSLYGSAYYTAYGTEMKVYGNLTGFYCSGNRGKITALDPSHNTQLKWLDCSYNQLSSLDVSHNTQLEQLYCDKNQLTSLDVSKNTQLKTLYCNGNNLSTQALDDIYCTLPLRQASDLAVIYPIYSASSSYNDTVIATNAHNATDKNWMVKYSQDGTDISTTGSYVCPESTMSRYITLTVTDGASIKLDLQAAAAATPVRIVSGSNTQDITIGTSWYGIDTYTADGTEMKVYGDLTGFNCFQNGANLTALDLSHNTQLKWLDCQSNGLNSLDVSKNTLLTKLDCSDNNLSSLDISKNTQLMYLYCIGNKLSSLDISKNTQLTMLYCHGNDFTTSAIDDIYCALPVRSASDNAEIVPVESASAPNHATVLATNKANATAKNWKVLYYDNTDLPATTGKHKCSATDIAEATAEQALTLYPNPVADVLYLSATARTIRIYNVYGIEVSHATDTDRVEVSHLPAGIYTVKADGTVAKMVKR